VSVASIMPLAWLTLQFAQAGGKISMDVAVVGDIEMVALASTAEVTVFLRKNEPRSPPSIM